MATKQVEEVTPVRGSEYGFSGKMVTVEFMRVKDDEPVDIFVGVNSYQATIKRGVRVTIPEEAFDVVAQAKYVDKEDDPDRPGYSIPVEKQRYPYNVISRS